jgi:hypothetical protein
VAGTNRNTPGWDNVALGMLSVFQAMMLSGWSFMTYRAMDVVGGASAVFFVAMVFFGAYFVVSFAGVG